MTTITKGDVILDLGPGDYDLCREALRCLGAGEPSMARTLAAVRFGGRGAWAEVVGIWERRAEQAGGEIAHLRATSEGGDKIAVEAWPGSLESYTKDLPDSEPLPWETA